MKPKHALIKGQGGNEGGAKEREASQAPGQGNDSGRWVLT